MVSLFALFYNFHMAKTINEEYQKMKYVWNLLEEGYTLDLRIWIKLLELLSDTK